MSVAAWWGGGGEGDVRKCHFGHFGGDVES